MAAQRSDGDPGTARGNILSAGAGTRLFGSFEVFEEQAQAGIDAGKLDRTDMPVVIDALRRWERDGASSQRHNTGDRVMAQGV